MPDRSPATLGIALKDNVREQTLLRSRVLVACVGMALLLLALVARIVGLQVVEYEHFKTRSHENRVKIVPLAPTRGLIRDRNGILLAQNVPTYSLELVPEAVPDLDATLRRLAALIPIGPRERERFARARAGKSRFESVAVRSRLTEQEVARFAVNRHRFPGVDVHARLTRQYPLGALASHAVGYVGRISEGELARLDESNYRGSSHIGKAGVEKAYEGVLHGRVGYSQVETNAAGRILRVLSRTDPVPGSGLHLTIDVAVQAAAEQAFAGETGALVALEPSSGAILALASLPVYDPNLFVHGIDVEDYRELTRSPLRPLFNRALAGQYPPGSTVKPFLGLEGLEEDAHFARGRVNCRGYFQLKGHAHRYRDWKRGGHGWVGLDAAIAESCDVYFYTLALELGIDRMHRFMTRFGFGLPTGVDLEGEATGLMPSRAWKRAERGQVWFPGETLIAGIGQGFMLATPLQLAVAAATLATRGERLEPRIVERVVDPVTGEETIIAPRRLEPVALAGAEAWQRVIDAMVEVVHGERGTARRVGTGAPVRIAGKTGTSQVYSIDQKGRARDLEELERELRDHGLFLAFAPAEAPRIAVAVVVEHAGSGSRSAAPIAREVIDAFFEGAGPPGPEGDVRLTAVPPVPAPAPAAADGVGRGG